MDNLNYFFINSGNKIGYTVLKSLNCNEESPVNVVDEYSSDGYTKNMLAMGIRILKDLMLTYSPSTDLKEVKIKFISPIVATLRKERKVKEGEIYEAWRVYKSLECQFNVAYEKCDAGREELLRIKREMRQPRTDDTLFDVDFIAYTDGSCDNTSPFREGGAAYIISQPDGKVFRQSSRGFIGTTNNRMELMAIMSAVAATPEGSKLLVVTDSEYCITMLSNPANADRIGMKNEGIIHRYFKYAEKLKEVRFQWVKGHNGHPLNEMVDEIARSRTEEMKYIHNIENFKG